MSGALTNALRKRIEELETAIREDIEAWENNAFDPHRNCKQLISKEK